MSQDTGQTKRIYRGQKPQRSRPVWVLPVGIAGIAVVGLCAVVLCGVGTLLAGNRLGWRTPPTQEIAFASTTARPELTETRTPFMPQAPDTVEPEITSTLTPSPMPVLTVMPSPTPNMTIYPLILLDLDVMIIAEIDSMVMVPVPGGEFLMGTSDEQVDGLMGQHSAWQRDWFTHEQPQHKVSLAPYWIDQTEVRNRQYAKCVAMGACKPPNDTRSMLVANYYGNPDFADFPVIYVDWEMAAAYCQWAGRRLPTEAEWEMAARGTDGRTYPWGEEIDCEHANYASEKRYCVANPMLVGYFPAGASPYGALDMAGNVWEWVADWDTGYTPGDKDNPLGLSPDIYRMARGGSYKDSSWHVRSSLRTMFVAAVSREDVGFRCALTPEL